MAIIIAFTGVPSVPSPGLSSIPISTSTCFSSCSPLPLLKRSHAHTLGQTARKKGAMVPVRAQQQQQLPLTEESVLQALQDSRTELMQLFDASVGITGVVELVDVDGPFVTIRLRGRFWHERTVVFARLANYLQKRIPEILEVQIEDEDQFDDSPSNF